MSLFRFGKKKPDPDEEYARIISEANAKRDQIIEDANVQSHRARLESESLYKKAIERMNEAELEVTRLHDEIRKLEELAVKYEVDPWWTYRMVNDDYAKKVDVIVGSIEKLIDAKRAASSTNPLDTDEDVTVYERRYQQIVRCFCAEADMAIAELISKPFGVVNRNILKIFKSVNKLFEPDGVALSEHLLDLKVQQCIATSYALKE